MFFRYCLHQQILIYRTPSRFEHPQAVESSEVATREYAYGYLSHVSMNMFCLHDAAYICAK
jgi:hypothetical protein